MVFSMEFSRVSSLLSRRAFSLVSNMVSNLVFSQVSSTALHNGVLRLLNQHKPSSSSHHNNSSITSNRECHHLRSRSPSPLLTQPSVVESQETRADKGFCCQRWGDCIE